MNWIRKILSAIKSLIKYCELKVLYRNKFNSNLILRLGSQFHMSVNNGSISIDAHFATDRNVGLYSNHGEIIIGKNVFVNENSIFTAMKRIDIADDTIFGPNVVIYDHDHRFGSFGVEKGYNCGDVVIGKHCWIGANVLILRGTKIGDNCVIGAGCIIAGEIPPNSIVTPKRDISIMPLRKNNSL
ncbi:acyltransferase [Eubacterium aggregans]|uniref:acyltransferase n=1 Tax=Eubacterium aggregans TaxID=81409 RepID=UPI003F3ECF44